MTYKRHEALREVWIVKDAFINWLSLLCRLRKRVVDTCKAPPSSVTRHEQCNFLIFIEYFPGKSTKSLRQFVVRTNTNEQILVTFYLIPPHPIPLPREGEGDRNVQELDAFALVSV